MSQSQGLDTGNAPRIASGFGGGIGGGGSVCGALVGAVMAVGLKYGRNTSSQDANAARERSLQVMSRFRRAMGSEICSQLTGMDLSTPEGVKEFRASEVPERVCRNCIGVAARLAEEALSVEP